jgi:hypothetical protein
MQAVQQIKAGLIEQLACFLLIKGGFFRNLKKLASS